MFWLGKQFTFMGAFTIDTKAWDVRRLTVCRWVESSGDSLSVCAWDIELVLVQTLLFVKRCCSLGSFHFAVTLELK